MTSDARKINYFAVVVTCLVAFACSMVWYSPLLFGNIWMESRGVSDVTIPAWKMLVAPLREFIVAYVLAYLIVRLEITHWVRAAGLGLGLWLAFHAVQMAGAVIWDNMSWQLASVHGGDWLMKMLLMSVVLSLWNRISQGRSGARSDHARGPA